MCKLLLRLDKPFLVNGLSQLETMYSAVSDDAVYGSHLFMLT